MSESCESHLEYFRDAFKRNESWALDLLGSWLEFTSHPSPENLVKFGPFESCQNFQIYSNSSQIIRSQYCLVSYSSILWQDIEDATVDYASESLVERDMLVFKNGICLPALCSSSQTVDFVKRLLSETNYIVLSVLCQQREELPLSLIDFALSIFVVSLLLLTLYGTYRDAINRDCRGRSVRAFSLRCTLERLVPSDDDKCSSIDCINGMKVIAALWLIVGHRMDMMVEQSHHQLRLFMTLEEKVILRMAEMFTTVVDTFFVISGILVASKCMALLNDGKFCYLNFCLSRFVRFTACLALIFAFAMSSFAKMLACGPQVSALEEELEECRQSWLGSLLLLRNFQEKQCLRHTWYTSTDFQLFIISPAIIYGLFKFRRKFLRIIAFIVLLGQINIFILKLSTNSSEDQDFYYETRYRFMPWFVGIITGYIMQISEKNSIGQDSRRVGWTVSLAALIALEFLRSRPKSRLGEALYEASHRVIFSCSVSWIIYACQHQKSGGVVRRFLSHRYWRPLSKMCLSIYLVHYLNVLLSFANMKEPYQFGVFSLIKVLTSDVLSSLCFAALFFVLFEAPLTNLVRATIT